MGETIEVKVRRLTALSDDDLVNTALDHIENNVSSTRNSLVETVCNTFKQGVVLSSNDKSMVAIFIAFEELTQENQ
jgi:hypothetical protein